MRFTERLKRGWMAFALRLGKIQTAIVLFVVYAFVLGPLSLVMRGIVRRDLLEMRHRPRPSFAHSKKQVPTDPERCERQF